MKILFVGSSTDGAAIIRAQGETLVRAGHDLDYFFIAGGGVGGYIKALSELRTLLRRKSYDVIHAHYLWCGIVASFASGKKPVVSLMGSDILEFKLLRQISKWFIRHRWGQTIVKSDEMKKLIGISSVHVVPNGVDLSKFNPQDRELARAELGWTGEAYVLFGANPARPEKNFPLAEQAVVSSGIRGVQLIPLKSVPHAMIGQYLNASDLLLLTSLHEGSPNIIKEAMACDCPVVSTDVGDVKWLLGEMEGTYVAGFDAKELGARINEAHRFRRQARFTKGRQRLITLTLDAGSVVEKLTDIYSMPV